MGLSVCRSVGEKPRHQHRQKKTKNEKPANFDFNPLHPRSVCIFSTLFSIPFLGGWQGEFVQQSQASLVDDHFLYSRDL